MRRLFPSRIPSRHLVVALVLTVIAGVALAGVSGRGPFGALQGQRPGGAVGLAGDTRKPVPVAGDPTLVAARAAVRYGVGNPTLALTRLALHYPRLSGADRRQARQLLARPSDGAADPYLDGYSVKAKQRTRCTEHFCIHYVANTADAPPMADRDDDGTPDWVQRVQRVAERVWTTEIDDLGYRPPAPDGHRGGDSRLDVYLAQLSSKGLYGYCPAERAVRKEPYVFSGYCVLDDDFVGYPRGPVASLRVTMAHEFFHTVQYAYDAAEDPWLMEATATWMEDQVADGVDDNRQYLPYGQLGDPTVPLDQSPPGSAPYGDWIFFEALSTAYGVNAVRGVWRLADSAGTAPDYFSTQAVDAYLQRHGTTLRDFYTRFAADNLAPDSAYPEATAGDYPHAPVAAGQRLRDRTPSYTRTLRLDHLTSATVALAPGRNVGSRDLLVRLDLPDATHSPGAIVTVQRLDGRRRVRPVSLDATGAGTVRTGFDPAAVKRVLVTVTNVSLRFRCWRDSSFSCQGLSRDDTMRFEVSAELRARR